MKKILKNIRAHAESTAICTMLWYRPSEEYLSRGSISLKRVGQEKESKFLTKNNDSRSK
jgi:hypothetical protein